MDSVRIVLMQSSSRACVSAWVVVIFLSRSLSLRSPPGSIPFHLMRREQARADHAGVGSAPGQRNRHPLPEGGERARCRLLAGAVEEEVRGAGEAAADEHLLGLEDIDVAGYADAEPGAEPVEQHLRVGVPLLRRRHHLTSGHAAVFAVDLAEPGVGPALAELRGVSLQCGPAAERLGAAAVGTVAGTGRAIGDDREVPE